ncbi:MAG: biotin/lipoate A/B protein ligase family protein [Victivallaceae bacterium]|nr:biotin/lipoate A/B protein ligase family protein [Victivallaceae bacterium]
MSSEKWLLWLDGVHSPFFNMAIDELLLENAPAVNRPLLRIYRWDRPSVSIGCSQLFPEEAARDYTVVRRPTGGGNVWHDRDLTYTVTVPAGHPIVQLDRMASYRIFHEAMLPMVEHLGGHAVIKSDETPGVVRATMRCFTSPSRFDLMAEAGGKYAGAAQRRTRNGLLHQGSISLEASHGDWEALSSALRESLAAYFKVEYEPFTPDADLIARAEKLAEEKYAGTEWNRG